MGSASIKPVVTVKGVADVTTLQTNVPALKVVLPIISAGHPNEAPMAAAYNAAQQALTPGEAAYYVRLGNALGGTKGWEPSAPFGNI